MELFHSNLVTKGGLNNAMRRIDNSKIYYSVTFRHRVNMFHHIKCTVELNINVCNSELSFYVCDIRQM